MRRCFKPLHMPSTPSSSHDIGAIRAGIDQALNTRDAQGRKVGDAKYGVYAFYDYDEEPIYVGGTTEKMRVRVRRHLTNQRTDAVAMNVLDVLEVAYIELWPFFDLAEATRAEASRVVAAAEYTVFEKVLAESSFAAVLNEKDIAPTDLIDLPPSVRVKIVPDDVYERMKHPDVRIARRASTIANLSRVISERSVSKGLRRTLVTQARRLERLARERLDEVGGEYPVAEPGTEPEVP